MSPIITGKGAVMKSPPTLKDQTLFAASWGIISETTLMYTPVQYVNLSMRERADFVDAWHFSVQGLRRQESKKVSVLRLSIWSDVNATVAERTISLK